MTKTYIIFFGQIGPRYRAEPSDPPLPSFNTELILIMKKNKNFLTLCLWEFSDFECEYLGNRN